VSKIFVVGEGRNLFSSALYVTNKSAIVSALTPSSHFPQYKCTIT